MTKTNHYRVLKPRFIWRGTPERRPYTLDDEFAARSCALLRRAVQDGDLALVAPAAPEISLPVEKPAKRVKE